MDAFLSVCADRQSWLPIRPGRMLRVQHSTTRSNEKFTRQRRLSPCARRPHAGRTPCRAVRESLTLLRLSGLQSRFCELSLGNKPVRSLLGQLVLERLKDTLQLAVHFLLHQPFHL